MTAPIAELRDIRVAYQGRVVLDVQNFSLERGGTLTIMGPNGSGKSTLLRVLALLDRPTRGQVFHDGELIENGGEALRHRRRLALVMQQPLLRNASTRENVATGLRFRHVPRAEVRERVDIWLERMGIAHLARRNALSLSGGEAQRTSLARALVLEPDLLLLDEPFAALDPPTRQALLEDLRHVLDLVSTTTLFVTHDRSEAQALGDRIAVIIGGQVRQIGSHEEVFSTPSSEEVAVLVGVENIFRGSVTSCANGLTTVLVGRSEVAVVGEFDVGEELVMGIPPEAVVLEPVSGRATLSSALNRLEGPIDRVTPLGALARVVVDCGFPVVSLVTRQSVLGLGLERGVSVVATFKATGVHVIRRGGRLRVAGDDSTRF